MNNSIWNILTIPVVIEASFGGEYRSVFDCYLDNNGNFDIMEFLYFKMDNVEIEKVIINNKNNYISHDDVIKTYMDMYNNDWLLEDTSSYTLNLSINQLPLFILEMKDEEKVRCFMTVDILCSKGYYDLYPDYEIHNTRFKMNETPVYNTNNWDLNKLMDAHLNSEESILIPKGQTTEEFIKFIEDL